MQAEIAALRFGLGARPGELKAAAADPRAWLMAQIQGPAPLTIDARRAAAPLAPSDQIFSGFLAARKSAGQTADTKTLNVIREAYQPHYRAQVLARAQSAALTIRPFAERLVHFWTNHFAVSADKGVVFGLAATLENEAIRPHIGGRFADLLMAVEQHPAMIAFLDNQYSAGKDSTAAGFAARGLGGNFNSPKRQFGINENLAREILELHTLGVNGGYAQADVTSFAQVLTGWSLGGGNGRLAGGVPGRFYFRENLHQPGAKVVLGKTYPEQGQRQGEAVLVDLANRPETARLIATKLVRHFVSDEPPQAIVAKVARAFVKSGGDLPAVYAALIGSPEAWQADVRKFKTPQDFVFSTLRALDISPAQPEEVVRTFELLGQRQYTPGSPAGWPDTSKSWDGSDALMHRVIWASRMGATYEKGVEPAALAASSLGGYARPETVTALRRAASSGQAVALLLMSPEFQRR